MYCPQCNEKTNENVVYCEKCGTKLKKDTEVSMLIRRMPKKKLALVILGMLVSVVLVYMLIPKLPSEEQIKKDIQQNILTKEDVITEMLIVQEEKNKKTYDVLVSMVYEDESVEYKEKYRVVYSKKNKWEFAIHEDYNTETWEMRAIAEPSEEVLKKITPNIYNKYNTTTTEIKNKDVDLDKQTVFCTYVYKDETITRSYEWRVECQYEFDSGWKYVDHKCIKEKVVENLTHSWEGTAKKQSQSNQTEKVEEKFQFKIVSANKGVLTAEIIQGDVVHQMKGTYNSYSYDDDKCQFSMEDIADEKYYFYGNVSVDGSTVKGTLCTNYTSNYSLYVKSQTYDVELKLK